MGKLITPYNITDQMEWSRKTFGPGTRHEGIIKHIEKELKELRTDPGDIFEWVDVLILAIDGAWRAGYTSQDIIDAYHQKMAVNKHRKWPDWQLFDQETPIEHAD